jgi:alpha-D-ribose 1-methylphosphonate 5-triphosphate synthase subunit PhnH
MTSQGSPYTIFRRALERGSLPGVRAAVANLPAPPPLDDALVICLLLLDQEPDRYERAALNYPERPTRVLYAAAFRPTTGGGSSRTELSVTAS